MIREEDLLTNRRIMRMLADPVNLEFFSELLATGLVKILRLPPEIYPAGRRFDPVRLPISARVEEHQLRRSYKGKPWRPTKAEWALISRLDGIVTQHPNASRSHAPFPDNNPFAEQLAELLGNREGYALSAHPIFRHVHPVAAEAFMRFCREPEAWIRFLHDAGLANPILGPDGGFYRTAAYQCFALLPNPRAMRRLVESVYAAVYCDREISDGRYGGSELVELPYRYPAPANVERPEELATMVEVVPTLSSAAVAVFPGMAEVLIRTRESPAFETLQRSIERLGNAESELDMPTEIAFREAWRDISAVYASSLARQLAHPSAIALKLMNYSVWAYVITRVLGFVVLPHGPLGLDWPVLGDAAIASSIEKWGPSLLQGFRATLLAPKLQESLNFSVRIRCSQVALNPIV